VPGASGDTEINSINAKGEIVGFPDAGSRVDIEDAA
jgi:hypothetical protein